MLARIHTHGRTYMHSAHTQRNREMKPKANDTHDNPAASRKHKNTTNGNETTMLTSAESKRERDSALVTTMTVKCDNSLMCPANTTS